MTPVTLSVRFFRVAVRDRSRGCRVGWRSKVSRVCRRRASRLGLSGFMMASSADRDRRVASGVILMVGGLPLLRSSKVTFFPVPKTLLKLSNMILIRSALISGKAKRRSSAL